MCNTASDVVAYVPFHMSSPRTMSQYSTFFKLPCWHTLHALHARRAYRLTHSLLSYLLASLWFTSSPASSASIATAIHIDGTLSTLISTCKTANIERFYYRACHRYDHTNYLHIYVTNKTGWRWKCVGKVSSDVHSTSFICDLFLSDISATEYVILSNFMTCLHLFLI